MEKMETKLAILNHIVVAGYSTVLVQYSDDDWTSKPTIMFSMVKTNDINAAIESARNHGLIVGATKMIVCSGILRDTYIGILARLQAQTRGIDYDKTLKYLIETTQQGYPEIDTKNTIKS